MAVGCHTQEHDIFTRILAVLIPRAIRFFGRSPGPEGFYALRPECVQTISITIGTVLASMLPTLAILVLYYVKSIEARLGLILIFTSVLSVILAIGTKARKVEIFATTTA